MSRSPGHQKMPDHKVREHEVDQRMTVEVGGEPVADSTRVIRVDEDGNPQRYYFPREDVRMDLLQRSQTTTECPFKGTAHYYGLEIAGRSFEDAVWTYEEPYDEHVGLKDRLAFYDDKYNDIRVQTKT